MPEPSQTRQRCTMQGICTWIEQQSPHWPMTHSASSQTPVPRHFGQRTRQSSGSDISLTWRYQAGSELLAKSDALAQASAQIGQDVSQKVADDLKMRLIEALRQKGRKP